MFLLTEKARYKTKISATNLNALFAKNSIIIFNINKITKIMHKNPFCCACYL